jgi:hypothetical protein
MGRVWFAPILATRHERTRGAHFFLAHDFCGRRCAGEFNNNGRRSSPPPRDIMCIIPGCRNRAFLDADGKATKFCSHRHRLYVCLLDGDCPETSSDTACNEQRGCSTRTGGCLPFVCDFASPVRHSAKSTILHKAAGKSQQLRSVASKAISVPNIAAWLHSAEVSLPIAGGAITSLTYNICQFQ